MAGGDQADQEGGTGTPARCISAPRGNWEAVSALFTLVAAYCIHWAEMDNMRCGVINQVTQPISGLHYPSSANERTGGAVQVINPNLILHMGKVKVQES